MDTENNNNFFKGKIVSLHAYRYKLAFEEAKNRIRDMLNGFDYFFCTDALLDVLSEVGSRFIKNDPKYARYSEKYINELTEELKLRIIQEFSLLNQSPNQDDLGSSPTD